MPKEIVLSNPEQAALAKIQELIAVVEKSGSINLEIPDAKLVIHLRGGNDQVAVGLLEGIETSEIYGLESRQRKVFVSTLIAFLGLNNRTSPSISADVITDSNHYGSLVYRPKEKKRITSYSPISTLLSTIKDEDLREIPAFAQMPESIDFPAATIKACELALAIAQDRQLTPERIAGFREVLYGQAKKV